MCVQGTVQCTVADSAGAFTLTGVPATHSGITGSLSGHLTGEWPLTLTGNSSFSGRLWGPTVLTQWAQQLAGDAGAGDASVPMNPGDGAIFFVARSDATTALQGVSITIAPSGGNVAYFDATSPFPVNPSLTMTSANGGGVVLGVPAATVTITATATGKTCVSQENTGYPAASPGELQVPVFGGELTSVIFQCN